MEVKLALQLLLIILDSCVHMWVCVGGGREKDWYEILS